MNVSNLIDRIMDTCTYVLILIVIVVVNMKN